MSGFFLAAPPWGNRIYVRGGARKVIIDCLMIRPHPHPCKERGTGSHHRLSDDTPHTPTLKSVYNLKGREWEVTVDSLMKFPLPYPSQKIKRWWRCWSTWRGGSFPKRFTIFTWNQWLMRNRTYWCLLQDITANNCRIIVRCRLKISCLVCTIFWVDGWYDTRRERHTCIPRWFVSGIWPMLKVPPWIVKLLAL